MAAETQALKLTRSQRAELLVFGFVKELGGVSYPKELVELIFLWYFINEEWDKKIKAEAIEIIDDLSVVHTDYNKGCWQGALGINECKSGKHEWKLQITKAEACQPDNTIKIMVGICEEKNWKKMVNNHLGPGLSMYCFLASITALQAPGIWKDDYAEPFEKEGDTIELYLDMDNKTLSYTVNGNDYGVAFKDIEEGNYRLAVSICVNRTITLIQ